MSRPYLLYHWAPRSRRKSILRHGLCPNKPSHEYPGWRPPYVCFALYPSCAWQLSAAHTKRKGKYDLWCVWSDKAKPFVKINVNDRWWLDEYRVRHRLPASKVWFVGTREYKPRSKRKV